MTTIERGQLTRDMEAQIRGQMPDVIASLRAKASEHAVEAPRREAGYSIQNAAGDEAVVRIYDEIWFLGVNALDLATDLDAITAPKIRVEINSPGGDVFDGIAIYNSLRNHEAEITTRVDGIAASIASVIAQAGDHRIMVAASQMMIHNAWGLTVGDSGDHEDMAGILRQQDDVIASIYAARSGKPADEFIALMDAETWMTADQAVEHGLADEVFTPPSKAKDDTLEAKIAAAVSAADVAVSSAETVSAIRAEVGKTLSMKNRESLSGLRDSIDEICGLLNDETDEHPDVVDARMALAKRTNTFAAGLPPQFLT
jgi:ATP-dependent Clp endopeptidase proteolytic subunit ClpP